MQTAIPIIMDLNSVFSLPIVSLIQAIIKGPALFDKNKIKYANIFNPRLFGHVESMIAPIKSVICCKIINVHLF